MLVTSGSNELMPDRNCPCSPAVSFLLGVEAMDCRAVFTELQAELIYKHVEGVVESVIIHDDVSTVGSLNEKIEAS